MKKILTYISFFAALVFAASCINDRVSRENGEDDGNITLYLQTSSLETRAGDSEADIEYAVTHADFFFFADAEGTDLIYKTRLTVEDGDLVPAGTNKYKYTFDTSSEDSPIRKTSYLYVIANYPTETEIPATLHSTTLDDILGLDINTDLSETFNSFVMDSYHLDGETEKYVYQLKPSQKEEEGSFTIGLTRAAAKLVLTVNVADSYTDELGNVWKPVFDGMWVNFVNARKTALVKAEPVEFDEKENYFSTEQETPTKATSAPTGFTSWKVSSVYTYPQSYETSDVTAPYFKIFCRWSCEKYNMSNFYYKVLLPNLGSFKRNKVYNLTVNLSTIGGDQDDWALVSDYIYVADWWAPEKIEATFEGAMYLDVPVKYYEIYGVDDIIVPVISSNDITINGSSATTVTVTGKKRNLYNYQTETYDDVDATVTAISKDGFKLTHELDDRMYIMQGNNKVKNPKFDCTPITYTLKVKHASGGLSKEITVTIVQYPSIYASADASNQYAFVNRYSRKNGQSTAYNNRPNGNQSLGSLNQVGQQGSLNNNGNQYVVNVSVLPEGYKVQGMTEDVVIGDPRGGKLTYNYLGYPASGNNPSYTVQENYNAVSTNTQNVIAPSIRIASSWGAQGTMQSYDRSEERCAAYQENGYPAGRWRVPTVAEIDFLIQLSTYNHIPELFTCRDRGSYYEGYWTNGPGAYAGKPYTDDGSSKPYEIGTISNASNSRVRINGSEFDLVVRCVYDEWYWGDTKYGNNGQPTTGNAATQWLGYIF